jgi:hypothetical protein
MVSQSDVVEWSWSSVRQFLPLDLDGLAVESGCLVRRRGVCGGEALARTLMLVGLPNTTIERASRLALEHGFAKMNSTALFKRLRGSEGFLKAMFCESLKHAVDVGERWKKRRLLAVDATVLCGPGATGTDQRLHTVYDLAKGLPLSVELTGPERGEALWQHHSFGVGDLLLCDSGYGYNRSFLWALNSGASFLIRFNFATVTLFDEQGCRIWAEDADSAIPESGTTQMTVKMLEWAHPLRAIGGRNLKGEPRWLLTDLSDKELLESEARELYRKRWQVELFFKRLKSLLDMDQLPTRAGPTARPWIWAKLLLASLAVLIGHERFSPWGPPGQPRGVEPLESLRLRTDHPLQGPPHASSQAKARKAKRQAETQARCSQATLLLEA